MDEGKENLGRRVLGGPVTRAEAAQETPVSAPSGEDINVELPIATPKKAKTKPSPKASVARGCGICGTGDNLVAIGTLRKSGGSKQSTKVVRTAIEEFTVAIPARRELNNLYQNEGEYKKFSYPALAFALIGFGVHQHGISQLLKLQEGSVAAIEWIAYSIFVVLSVILFLKFRSWRSSYIGSLAVAQNLIDEGLYCTRDDFATVGKISGTPSKVVSRVLKGVSG
jgi:hypothetical protein